MIRFWLTLTGVAALDQLSKWWILTGFAPFEQRPVIPGFFNIVRVSNTGVAFGLLAGDHTWWRQALLAAVTLSALAFLFFYLRRLRTRARILVHALGLIAGGAVGNLIDRLRFGAVVDFLDFYVGRYHWPAFNAADSAICIGVGLLLWDQLRPKNE